MSGARFVAPFAQFIDANGSPLPGAQLFFYETGTSTPQNTYTTNALSTPNSNPVVANSGGLFPDIWLLNSPAYKVVLEDQNGVVYWTADPVGPGATNSVPAYLIGVMLPYAGIASSIPAGAVQLYGQAVSRTANPLTFAALGTNWGVGDGSTTFNLPDMRGRALFGVDNMGGTAADRLTTSSLGSAAVLGATGGNELVQSHGHTLSVTITDPGHSHIVPIGQGSTGGYTAWTLAPPSGNTSVNLATQVAETGVTGGGTAVPYGGGASQNLPPAAVGFWIMFLG